MLVHRISEAENQIGGGLIEEVIQVAEGELKLVDTMAESKVYVSRLMAFRSTEGVYLLRRSMLTSNIDGRISKRSRRKVNGIILLEINTLRALRSPQISRYLLNQGFRRIFMNPRPTLINATLS